MLRPSEMKKGNFSGKRFGRNCGSGCALCFAPKADPLPLTYFEEDIYTEEDLHPRHPDNQ